MSILFLRSHALVEGLKGASGETGRVIVGPWEGAILERADGYMRLPLGKYSGRMCRMRDKPIRAIRFEKTSEEALRFMGPKTRESFDAGRIYAHGVARVDAAEQLAGCVGVPDVHSLWEALGGWREFAQFNIEIKEGV